MELSLIFALHLCSLTIFISEILAKQDQAQLQVVVKHLPDVCSEKAADGDHVAVHYTGYLETGTVFDSSVEQKRDPITFVLGSHKVIPGWEQGLQGMCVGEKRSLVIPPHLAYGEKGHPPVIPGGATLTFDIELMNIQKESKQRILEMVQFLAMPALVLYVLYYLYSMYKKQTSAQATTKSNKKGKKRR